MEKPIGRANYILRAAVKNSTYRRGIIRNGLHAAVYRYAADNSAGKYILAACGNCYAANCSTCINILRAADNVAVYSTSAGKYILYTAGKHRARCYTARNTLRTALYYGIFSDTAGNYRLAAVLVDNKIGCGAAAEIETASVFVSTVYYSKNISPVYRYINISAAHLYGINRRAA